MAYGKVIDPRSGSTPRVLEHDLRQEMVRVGRLLWERGLVAATDGNLSARLGSDRLLVTASGLSKGFLTANDLLVIRLDGTPLASYRGRGLRPSSEISMHLEVYRQRPDVQAVVHAHPPLATAFSIAGVSLARCVIPEVIVALGGIPTTGYATPGSQEVPASIRHAIRNHDALILSHHGSLTVGSTLWEAYLRLEKVEHTAQITLAAHQLGQVRTLSPSDVEKLVEKRRALLQQEGREWCQGCTVCVLGEDQELPSDVLSLRPKLDSEALLAEGIARAVVQHVRKS